MRKLIPLFFSALLVCAFLGCDGGSGPTTPDTTDPGGIDLDAEFGGLTFDDELPAFGEPSMFADELLAEDDLFDDLMDEDPEVSRLRNRNGSRVFALRINWGRLIRAGDGDSSGCRFQEIIYNWDGSLRIDRGAIILKRTINFEVRDYIHEREDCRLLEWTSKTGPHYDGILVEIVDPPAQRADSTDGSGGPEQAPNRVTFTTPQYSRTFSVEELVRISEVVPVNRCGIAVSFNGFLEPPSAPCPKGFLAGIWKPVSSDSKPPEPPSPPPDSVRYAAADTVRGGKEVRGFFYGNWIQANGMLAGHLRGVYGINSNGRRVFFGKYIDLSGNFRGILVGTYGAMSYAPYADTAGWFKGEWFGRTRRVSGYLMGHWVTGPYFAPGMFYGRWGTYCPDEPPDPGLAL